MRLVAHDVRVEFPALGSPVLDGATIEVGQGESVAVLGPSGSGKSTLLSVLGGLVRPSRGQVLLERDDGTRTPAEAAHLRASCAWVLQTVNVLPERTAVANVALGALARGSARHEARELAVRLLREVGLGHRTTTAARSLSGGELQRVVVARALASGRPFLLADEPTGQLDRTTSREILAAMLGPRVGVVRTGVVVVTHDPEVAERCDVTVRIEDGRVVPA
ncbi:ABC transporter ATP-binding protein [Cellulosimicrobium cellulans]|uniref:ABC transporter ATP-binding protein n=1 Tax=Cellulosimicrobium cellulans TaxID=1710 RepID=UPI00380899C1